MAEKTIEDYKRELEEEKKKNAAVAANGAAAPASEQPKEKTIEDYKRELDEAKKKGAQNSGTPSTSNDDLFALDSTKGFDKPHIIPGEYNALVEKIEIAEVKDFSSDAKVKRFKWTIQILSDSTGSTQIRNNDGSLFDKDKLPLKFFIYTSPFVSGERSNNYKFYTGITGQAPEGAYNPKVCEGMKCRVIIMDTHKEGDTSNVWSKISSFMRAR